MDWQLEKILKKIRKRYKKGIFEYSFKERVIFSFLTPTYENQLKLRKMGVDVEVKDINGDYFTTLKF